MHTLEFSWTTFKVDLADLDMWLRSNAQGYCGMSANSKCEMHFTAEPGHEILARCEQYWNALTIDQEATKIAQREHLEKVVKYATGNLPYVQMSTWSAAEIKIFMKQDLSLQDKDALAAKYPNV